MDFNATIDLIIRELDEAREIIDDLKKYPGAPVMQIELAKSKCRNASEVINMLKESPHKYSEIIKGKPEPEPLKKSPERVNPPEAHDQRPVEKQPVQPEQKAPDPEPQKPSPVEVKSSAKPLPRDIPDGPSPEKENKIPEQKTIVGKAEKKRYPAPIIADTFSHLANSYNEQAGDTQQYSSLSDVIGVNDRFLYIREIFNGDDDAYHQALSRLDKAETITEAKVVLMSFKEDKKENAAMKQLMELVKRKFSRNE